MKILTPLEIYKILPQSNCSRCLLPSCLAFAAAVVAGQRRLADCPELATVTVEQYENLWAGRDDDGEAQQAAFIAKMEEEMAALDLAAVALERGGVWRDGLLYVAMLGKDFAVDGQGQLHSTCHIIPWVQAPLLSYITYGSHAQITGEWLSFREIDGGIDWQGLFSRRCERPLAQLAQAHPSLLTDLIDLFMGQATTWYEADIALILHPLPHIPILICYQGPEDDLPADLTIFFDACCGKNLHIKSLYTLCAGLVQMFAKIAERHV